MCRRVFNKTIILLGLAGYEMIITNSALLTGYLSFLIIRQAPRAGSMQRILCSDLLPERAKWSDTARQGLSVSFPQINFAKVQAGA